MLARRASRDGGGLPAEKHQRPEAFAQGGGASHRFSGLGILPSQPVAHRKAKGKAQEGKATPAAAPAARHAHAAAPGAGPPPGPPPQGPTDGQRGGERREAARATARATSGGERGEAATATAGATSAASAAAPRPAPPASRGAAAAAAARGSPRCGRVRGGCGAAVLGRAGGGARAAGGGGGGGGAARLAPGLAVPQRARRLRRGAPAGASGLRRDGQAAPVGRGGRAADVPDALPAERLVQPERGGWHGGAAADVRPAGPVHLDLREGHGPVRAERQQFRQRQAGGGRPPDALGPLRARW